MTDRLFRHITCDRCGKAWTGSSNRQPEDWRALLIVTTPLGSSERQRFHICDECDVDLARFLKHAWRVAPDEPA